MLCFHFLTYNSPSARLSPTSCTEHTAALSPKSLLQYIWLTYIAHTLPTYTLLRWPGCPQLWTANLRNMKLQQICLKQAWVHLPRTLPHQTFQLQLQDSQPYHFKKTCPRKQVCALLPQTNKVLVAGSFFFMSHSLQYPENKTEQPPKWSPLWGWPKWKVGGLKSAQVTMKRSNSSFSFLPYQ